MPVVVSSIAVVSVDASFNGSDFLPQPQEVNNKDDVLLWKAVCILSICFS